jgi:hypothetical protein
MTPRNYTELFFLDEVTALAAGHRPCFQCRYRDYGAFRAAWSGGNRAKGILPGDPVARLDAVLHGERTGPRPGPQPVEIRALPAGALLEFAAEPGVAYAVGPHGFLRWGFGGYEAAGAPPGGPGRVLTPSSIVAALNAGYAPRWHGSATGRQGGA